MWGASSESILPTFIEEFKYTASAVVDAIDYIHQQPARLQYAKRRFLHGGKRSGDSSRVEKRLEITSRKITVEIYITKR